MRRLIVPGFALFALLAAGACGAPATTASPASQPAASQPATSAGPTSAPATACTPATEPVANPVAVTIADLTYSPDPVQAKVGGAIEWHNEDGVTHTATLDDLDCDTDQITSGQTGVLVFSEAGTYAYHCRIHSSMHGTITIAP
ncbi:MAG TPA: cupredoxin domain-containing protein [Candidatus Limnocylindrales bacterium]|jgi:plastocyanin|nr:cupredoxin domain-containing protein [Candidatus Limnocylindrales bacterium]